MIQEDSALFESWGEPETAKYSGYYSPTFANLDSLWFRNTTDSKYADGRNYLDSLWSSECDDILFQYVNKYGPYFSAFESDILNDIESKIYQKIDTQKVHFSYYIATKAHEIDKIEKIWISTFEEECKKKIKCRLCQYEEFRKHQAPKVVRGQNATFIYCSDCYHKTITYKSFWDHRIEERYIQLAELVNKKVLVNCRLCNSQFIHSPGIFRNVMHDLLYPNLFTSICGECFQKAYTDKWRGNKEVLHQNLYRLFLYIRRIPIYNFYSFQYLYKEEESLLQLFSFFMELRSPEGFKKLDGSFYKALVNSGILHANSNKKIYGNISFSNDGHICFSDLEKEIDNYLFDKGIKHIKEANYPVGNLLTNWKLEINEKVVFIENVELVDNKDLNDLILKKKWITNEYKIILIRIYPEDDWKRMISECIENL